MPTYLKPGVYVDEVAGRPRSAAEIEMRVARSVKDHHPATLGGQAGRRASAAGGNRLGCVTATMP